MMKTLLLMLAVPCLAFQPASFPFQGRTSRLQGAAVEEPPTKETSDLPPVLQGIVDERREFQMNLGKAMDTLRKDYPDIIRRMPDLSIYHDDIKVVDPSGVQLTGLTKYKNAIIVLQTLTKFLYTQHSGLQYRMVYDFCRSSIRVSWHVTLYPKVFGGATHVDGISVYTLDAASGKIVQHSIENLVINNNAVVPPYGIFNIVRGDEERQPVVAGGLCLQDDR